ncbi:MAG: hypothetical protein COX70_00760 [Flavobacteriales bacterium CG_4_10_14_0_2_um_filter_32_8]|nr:MAG: hypothetical protein COX70_00760 [Flavobacteriales bacterium CG_4_10_14_0_2_um_filter_32_8]PJB14186.1 MAG: hypothetical protein CO118_09975 [Flavobacteriales bacterium CG_4_9_14_3_um_filter_32_8]
MDTILIPTDFSEHAHYALEYASFITKEKGGKLIILNVYQHHKELENIQNKFKEIETYSYLKGVDYEFITEKGISVSNTISKVGIDYHVGLIIMGSNGVSNIEEMLLGSNTENVIRKSHFNVLTIKHRMPELKIKSILFPSDFMPEVYSIFEGIKNFSELFNAKIHLLNVTSSKDSKEINKVSKKMDSLIDFYQLKEGSYQKVIVKDKSEEFGILNYCIDNDIDIIAIGSHGKSVLHKLIKESTSQNVVRDSFRPILTMRFQENFRPQTSNLR